MKPITVLSVLIVMLSTGKMVSSHELHPVSDELTAKECEEVKNRNQFRLPELKHNLDEVEIPESFDWRDQSLNCPTIRNIEDQGSCGSCWAFATAGIISDRICIHSKGKLSVYISAYDLLTCCEDCSVDCKYGYPSHALGYWIKHGIVSGGGYGSTQGCKPYEIPSCKQDANGIRQPCELIGIHRPNCTKHCRSGYSTTYENDLHFGATGYMLPSLDVKQIQTEIMSNGPVTMTFRVYEDFLNYTHGVYKHSKGDCRYYHVVKVLGWGVENNDSYWLVANSWSTHWGDKGFFKILRGENHCGIEEYAYAGIPA